MSDYRYRIEQHANGESVLIRDVPGFELSVHFEDPSQDGTVPVESSTPLVLSDETTDETGQGHSLKWTAMNKRLSTHHIRVDHTTHKIIETPRD